MASHRRPARSGPVRAGRVTVFSAAAAAAAFTTTAVPAAATPRHQPAETAARVDALYRQAESATQQYDAAHERRARLDSTLEVLRDEIARDQQGVNAMRDGLAAVAGEQYRSGGLDPALTLILSSDPGSYLERASALNRIEGRQALRLRQLGDARRALDQKRREAERELSELADVRARLADRKRVVLERIGAARRLLGGLPPGSRDVLGQDAWRTGPVGPPPDPADLPATSARAAEALAAARSAVGRPYVWGAAGPGAFDCSGLTYWSYRHAGITLPRTSQEQLHAGRRVPLDRARPGDLVIYRGDASHVAMYAGGGEVIHAPYPGARVRYDRVDMLPVDAVVRP